MTAAFVLFVLFLLFVVVLLAKTVRIVPQARAGIVERFGKYKGTLPAGLNILVPFIDRLRYLIDLREQVVSFPPQPVITEDNLVVSIDTVIYFQVTDPVAATYEIANYIQAIEQLTMTTLRNIVGGMDLEETLTSRDSINSGLRGVLDEATGKWGIRVNRVELKGIDPPPSIKDSMEKQMRADREKRAVILTAEGQRQAAILTAEGSKQSQILNAQGDRESQILRAQADREASILRAQGEGQAIQTVFQAIHDGQPDQSLLAYQYLQMMPKIAEGSANKVWVIPSEITKAMEGLGSSIHEIAGIPRDATPRTRVDMGPTEPQGGISAVRGRRAQRRQQGRRGGHRGRRVGRAPQPGLLGHDARRAGRSHPAGRLRADGPVGRRGSGRPERPGGSPGVTWVEAVLIALAGVAAGTINTVVGSGTLITFPTLLAFGVPPVTANVSNSIGLVPGSVTGAIGYRRELRGQRSRLLHLASASGLGGLLGGGLLLWAPGAFEVVVPALILLGLLLVIAGPRISAYVARRHEASGGLPERGAWWVWPGMFACGVYGGYFGAAQGVLMMAVLGIGVDETLQRLNGAKNVLAALVNGISGVLFVLLADVDWKIVGLIAVGAVDRWRDRLLGGSTPARAGPARLHRRGGRRGPRGVPGLRTAGQPST